nr:hypothetical protein [Nocardia carnea]
MADDTHSGTSDPGRAPALRLAAILLGAGVMHFVAPGPFDSIVPKRLPGKARSYTYLSGVAEMLEAISLLRLPLQVPLITQALAVGRRAPRA